MNFCPSNSSSVLTSVRQKVSTSRIETLVLILMISIPILTVCVVILTIVFLMQQKSSPGSSIAESHTHSAGQPEKKDDSLHVIISAALAAVIDKPHRVISIVPGKTAPNWSIEGRRSHHTSHFIR